MKKLLLSALLFIGLQATAQITITKVGDRHILCMLNNDKSSAQYMYYISDTSRESSVRNISLADAFPDGKYDSTTDGICFELHPTYYTLYLRNTRTKYTCFNRSKNMAIFYDKFIKNICYIRSVEASGCRDFQFK